MTSSQNNIWVVTTGETGHVNQAVGLAEAIGLPFVQKTARVSRPWGLLPASWVKGVGLNRLLSEGSDAFEMPWPEVIIACGRRAGAIALAIREAACQGGQPPPFLVQILDPQVSPGNFDLVIAPDHDRLTGSNVLTTLGAIHRMTKARLDEGAATFEDEFKPLTRPLVGVLIGGPSGAYRFGIQDARRLGEQLVDLVERQRVGLVITASRRTGSDETALMRKAVRDLPGVLFWDGTGPNPYAGILALSDVLLVTEESVSMISEACFTGKPVYTLSLTGGSVRFTRFHQRMEEEGYARPYRGTIKAWTPPAPLDEAARIGKIVRERIDAL